MKPIAPLVLTASAAISAVVACGNGSSTPTEASYWPDSYNSSGSPTPGTLATDHPSNPGACLAKGCHGSDGTAKLKLIYGGVVYKPDGKAPAANVQVGVVEGDYKSFVYSWTNGMYWQEGTQKLKWDTTTDIRIRNAKGEVPKLPEQARGADCDSCHIAGTLPLKVLP